MAAALPVRERLRQGGVAMVEAALLIGLFFTLLLGVFELSRLLFLWNTLANVTRRAAATVAVSAPSADHSAALTGVAFGGVPLSVPSIDGSYFRVEYLNAATQAVATPVSATDNLRNCAQDPQGASGCARYVRVRLCEPDLGSDCAQVSFQPLFLVAGVGAIEIRFPTFETVVPVGSLGYRPGMN